MNNTIDNIQQPNKPQIFFHQLQVYNRMRNCQTKTVIEIIENQSHREPMENNACVLKVTFWSKKVYPWRWRQSH